MFKFLFIKKIPKTPSELRRAKQAERRTERRSSTSPRPDTLRPTSLRQEDKPTPLGRQFELRSLRDTHAVIKGKCWVVDGDTIDIKGVRIRLAGIDAPELEHPYGQKSKWAMVRLCAGHEVTARVIEFDHFGRTIAICTLADGRDIARELVKMGLAIDWPKYSGGRYTRDEVPGIRKKLWRCDARQRGRMTF